MHIIVRTPEGSTYRVSVKPSDTVRWQWHIPYSFMIVFVLLCDLVPSYVFSLSLCLSISLFLFARAMFCVFVYMCVSSLFVWFSFFLFLSPRTHTHTLPLSLSHTHTHTHTLRLITFICECPTLAHVHRYHS